MNGTSRGARFDLRAAWEEGTAVARAAPFACVLGTIGAWIGFDPGTTVRLDAGQPWVILDGLARGEGLHLSAWGFAMAFLGGLLTLALALVRAFATPAWIRAVDAVRRGERPPAPDASVVPRGVTQFGWRVLRAIVVGAGASVAALPGAGAALLLRARGHAEVALVVALLGAALPAAIATFVFAARLVLGDTLVALADASPVDALRGSWRLTSEAPAGAMGFLLGVAVLTVAGVMVGALACCVGWIVTLPVCAAVFEAGRVRAWREAVGAASPASG